MSRFKLAVVVMCALLSTRPGGAAEQRKAPIAKGPSFFNVLLGFSTWTERASISNTKTTDKSAANFFGNAVTGEYEHYPNPRWGYYWVGSLLYGIANVGGSQGTIPYQLAGQTWLGTVLSVRRGYRVYKQIAFTIGPILLYRQISLPGTAEGVTVSTGSELNYGATADMRIRLGDSWELRQEFGTLMVEAGSFWSLGFGYKF